MAVLFAVPALADMEVYRPRHRTGEDLRPLVEAALGPQGSVAVDGNTGSLVMIGSAPAVPSFVVVCPRAFPDGGCPR